MALGDQAGRGRARRGLRGGRIVLLLGVLLAQGCRSTPSSLVGAGRKHDPPPFSDVVEDSDDRDGNGEGEEGGGDADDPESEEATWPNVADPGPDMANFPNSAFTIPRGAAHVEFAPVTLSGPTDNNGPNYNTQYLLRYGLTDRLETRIFGIGYVAVFGGPQQTTGFAPPAFDLKMNLWDESKNHLIPATGLEVSLLTEFGSPALRSGVQPSLSLLFDHTLPFDFEFEWNVGVNGAQQPLNSNDKPNGPINLFHGPEEDTLEWNLQWALQRQFFGKLDVFTHGFINSATIPNLGDSVPVGGGGVYTVNKRLALFGSYNAGLTADAPTTFLLLDFAAAL
jgi:hypothetical protein